MALTRKFLKGMGLSEEQIDSIIESHTDTVNGLKEQIDELKDNGSGKKGENGNNSASGKNSGAAKNSGGEKEPENQWEKKYKELNSQFEEFKTKQAEKDAHAAKETALRKLLEEIGVSAKRINSVVKVSNIDGIELDDNGAIKHVDKLRDSLKTEWADFIEQKQIQGTNTATPPAGGEAGGKTANPKAAEIAARYYSNLYGTPAPQASGNAPDPSNGNKKE